MGGPEMAPHTPQRRRARSIRARAVNPGARGNPGARDHRATSGQPFAYGIGPAYSVWSGAQRVAQPRASVALS